MSEAKRLDYVPSGKVETDTFLVHSLLGVALAGMLASGLAWLTMHESVAAGWLVFFIVLVLTCWARWTVQESKCRNPRLAMAVSGGLGLLVILGHFHIDQCRRWDIGWGRLDRLPGYITFRMETDSWNKIAGLIPARVPLSERTGVHPWLPMKMPWNGSWLVMIIETMGAMLIPAYVAWRRSRRPFSETANNWCARESVPITPTSAKLLRQALRTEGLLTWALVGFIRGKLNKAHVLVEVWTSPPRPGQEANETETYLGVGGKHPMRLSTDEAVAIAVILPEVSSQLYEPEGSATSL